MAMMMKQMMLLLKSVSLYNLWQELAFTHITLDDMTLITPKKGKLRALSEDVDEDVVEDNSGREPLLYSWDDVIDITNNPDAAKLLPGLKWVVATCIALRITYTYAKAFQTRHLGYGQSGSVYSGRQWQCFTREELQGPPHVRPFFFLFIDIDVANLLTKRTHLDLGVPWG